MNNLKQLGLAIQNYSDAHGELLCGTVRQPSLTPDERLSWLVSLLPFVEQQQLYERFDRENGWASDHNQHLATAVKIFSCPSQPLPSSQEFGTISSYVGIAGVGSDAASLPLEDAYCGVFGYERRITLKDVKDGTSNTLCILETTRDNGSWAAGGRVTVRAVDPAQQPYLGEGRPFGMVHRQPFVGSFQFSRLPDVGNAAMLDGSVRTLDSSIPSRTLEALATIAGGEGP